MVGEEEERSARAELLSLKEKGRRPGEQDRRDEGSPATGARRPVQSLAARRVGDLVVVLEEDDEPSRVDVESRMAASLILPGVALALKEVSPFEGAQQLLRRTRVVRIVGLSVARQRDARRVMKVVVPDCVETEAAARERPDESRLLRLVLRNEQDVAIRRRLARPTPDAREHVLLRVVSDVLGGVEAQAVEVVFGDPVSGVRDDEFADRSTIVAIVVHAVTPVGVMALREIVAGERGEVVSVRAQVVVDHVENDADPERVRGVDEAPEVVGPTVEARRSVEVHPVVAPPELSGEVGDRHHLDDRDSEVGERGKVGARGVPRPLGSERAHVHLVEALPLERAATPAAVGPREARRIDHLRRTVRTLRLKARRGVGMQRRGAVEAETVPSARGDRPDAGKVATGLGCELQGRDVGRSFEHDLDGLAARGPQPEVGRSGVRGLRADRQPARADRPSPLPQILRVHHRVSPELWRCSSHATATRPFRGHRSLECVAR